MFCTACGEALPLGARYCGRCGVGVDQVDEVMPATQEQSETEEFWLATPRQHFEARPQVASKPRPWVRYFARMADIWFWGMVIAFVLGFAFPEWISETEDVVISLVLLLLIVPVQSVVSIIFGNTLGKALLGIKVTHQGKSLSFGDAMQREFLVYVKGLGFGIPLVSFVTMMVSYDKLSKNGFSSWDKENSFDVTHQDPSIGGVLGVVAIFIIMLMLNVLGSSQSY